MTTPKKPIEPIHCHNNERQVPGFGTFWNPQSKVRNAHRYRGSGQFNHKRQRMVWEPCTICGKGYAWRGHEDPYRGCSYCGSIHPVDLLEGIAKPERHNYAYEGASARFTGNWEYADWKYGWPHKIYADLDSGEHIKFYTRHLGDFPNLIDDFNRKFVSPVWFAIDQRGLKWSTGPKPERLLATDG